MDHWNLFGYALRGRMGKRIERIMRIKADFLVALRPLFWIFSDLNRLRRV
jgi:hypothetical protein